MLSTQVCVIESVKKENQMKNIIILLTSLLFASNTDAQTIKRSVIGAAGNTSAAGSVIIRSTVGETFTNKLSTANYSVRQGFQQGNISIARIANDETGSEVFEEETSAARTESLVNAINFTVDVYPNPATDYVNIRMNEMPLSKCVIYLSDATGRMVEMIDVVSSETRLEFTNLAQGRYFLSVKSQDGNVNESFKVVKQ